MLQFENLPGNESSNVASMESSPAFDQLASVLEEDLPTMSEGATSLPSSSLLNHLLTQAFSLREWEKTSVNECFVFLLLQKACSVYFLNHETACFTSLCLGLCGLLVSAESTLDSHPYLSLQERVQDIFNSSKDCVVRVKATRKDMIGTQTNRVLKMGSGFFVSKDGHVLTTGLLRNADQIWVEHQQSFYLAQLIGHDYLCNVSMLKVIESQNEFLFDCF